MNAKQGSKRGRENERKELGKRPGNIAFKEVPKQKKKELQAISIETSSEASVPLQRKNFEFQEQVARD